MWWEESTQASAAGEWPLALTILFGLGELYNIYITLVTGVDDEDWDVLQDDEPSSSNPLVGAILKQVHLHLSSHEVTIARDLASRLSRVRSPGTFFIQLARSKLVASLTGLDFNTLLLSLRPPSRHVRRRRQGKAMQKYVNGRHVASAISSFDNDGFQSCLSDDADDAAMSTPPASDESSEGGVEAPLDWMRRVSSEVGGGVVDDDDKGGAGGSSQMSPLSKSKSARAKVSSDL